MSISNDPEVYKLLVAIIGGVIAIFNTVALKMLSGLKNTDEKIFDRINKTDIRVARLEAQMEERQKICNERHRR